LCGTQCFTKSSKQTNIFCTHALQDSFVEARQACKAKALRSPLQFTVFIQKSAKQPPSIRRALPTRGNTMIARFSTSARRFSRIALASLAIAGTLVAPSITHAQEYSRFVDPAIVYASADVAQPNNDSARITVTAPTQTFFTTAQMDAATRGATSATLEGQVKLVGVLAPNGLSVATSDLTIKKFQDGVALELTFDVSTTGIGAGSYPVTLIFENISTGAKMPVAVVVNVG
jgi:hypothetical protein